MAARQVRRAGLALTAAGLVLLSRALLRASPGRTIRWASRRGPESAEAIPAARCLTWLASSLAAPPGRLRLSASCLERAVALCLASAAVRGGARLVIGVRPCAGGLHAHAWVERGGETLLGGAAAEGLHRLGSTAASDARS